MLVDDGHSSLHHNVMHIYLIFVVHYLFRKASSCVSQLMTATKRMYYFILTHDFAELRAVSNHRNIPKIKFVTAIKLNDSIMFKLVKLTLYTYR